MTTPVDVSEKVVKTSSTPGLAASCSSSPAGSILRPHSVSQWIVSAPYASHSSNQRSPNLPQDATRTGSPGLTRLATADSSAPVPELVKIWTSFAVWKTSLRRRSTRA